MYLCGAAQVVVVNLLDGLEVDDSLQLGLVFVCGTETSFGQKLKRLHFPGRIEGKPRLADRVKL